MNRKFLFIGMLLILIVAFSATAAIAGPKKSNQLAKANSTTVDVLIATDSYNYSSVARAINKAGGSVSKEYKYAKGLAATVPAAAVESLAALRQIESIAMDTLRTPIPTSKDLGSAPAAVPAGLMSGANPSDIDTLMAAGQAYFLENGLQTANLSTAEIENFIDTYYNPEVMNAVSVWDTGNFGQDSLAVVIDTGIYDQHFMLDGSVIGGEDISVDVGTAFEGFNLATNHWHGSHVSGILAGHGAIIVPNDDLLVLSIELHTGVPLLEWDADNKIIPLFGMAPAAQLYGIKVFPHTGDGAPTSTIIEAIELAIDLKLVDGLDVDVINMSLGGASLFEGRDLEDQVVDFATSVGIAVVTAVGNDGPTSVTVGSPGSANTSIAAGAVATPVQSRVFWDINFGVLGVGDLLYVDENPQEIYFSSRGPTSDGRMKPTASTTGFVVLSAFPTDASPQSIAWVSGTSMASPAMAGITALLNTHGETVDASPFDYKQALVAGATPLPGYDAYDQGAGFVDAADAMAALLADEEIGSAESLRNGYPRQSVQPKGTRLQGVNYESGITFDITDLAPGKAEHYFFRLHPNAERITIDVSNVDLGVDPIFFNSFEIYLQSSLRTFNVSYFDSVNVFGDASFVAESMSSTVAGDVFGVNTLDLPLMPGYVRLVIENDFTSFDNLSGTFTVNVEHGDNSGKADEVYSGSVNTGESFGFFPVGFGANGVELELSWFNDWQRYPASDLDMIVAWFDGDGVLHFEFGGATLNSPEIVQIDSNDIDAVLVLIDGFDTNGVDEPWELNIVHK